MIAYKKKSLWRCILEIVFEIESFFSNNIMVQFTFFFYPQNLELKLQ